MKHSSSNPGNFFYSFSWNFFGSLLIGTLTGCICAYFLKSNAKRQQGNHSESLENKEASIMVIIPWVCYLLADVIFYYFSLNQLKNLYIRDLVCQASWPSCFVELLWLDMHFPICQKMDLKLKYVY